MIKFEVDKTELLDAWGLIRGTLGKNSFILEKVYFSIIGNHLIMRTYNEKVMSEVKVTVLSHGDDDSFCIEPFMFSVISTYDVDSFTFKQLETKKGKAKKIIEVKGGTKINKFPFISSELFPKKPDIAHLKFSPLDTEKLNDIINILGVSVGDKDADINQQCLYFNVDEGYISSGNNAKFSLYVNNINMVGKNILLNYKVISERLNCIKAMDTHVSIHYGDYTIIRSDDIELIFNSVIGTPYNIKSGVFDKYEDIMPDTTIRVSLDDLIYILNTCNLYEMKAIDEANFSFTSMNISEREVTLGISLDNNLSNTDTLRVINYEGEEYNLKFKASRLLSILNKLKGDVVELMFYKDNSAIQVTSADESNFKYIQVY